MTYVSTTTRNLANIFDKPESYSSSTLSNSRSSELSGEEMLSLYAESVLELVLSSPEDFGLCRLRRSYSKTTKT
jgi:hypothetical protein